MENELVTVKAIASETQTIIDLATSITPVEIARIISRALRCRQDENLKRMTRNCYLPLARKIGIIRDDTNSFTDYIINRHKIPEQTTVYCQVDYSKFEVGFQSLTMGQESHRPGHLTQSRPAANRL